MHAGLPEKLAARIFKHTVLRLLLKHPEEIARLHRADLANVYSITGCDIVELRAVFFALLPVTFENDADGKKAEWKISVRRKLRAMTKTEERSQLMRNEVRHPAYQQLQSADGRGPFDPRAPLLQSKGAVKSNAFDPIEKPGGGSGEGGGGDEVSTERVQHIRTMLMAQAQKTNAAEEEAPLRRPTRTRGAVVWPCRRASMASPRSSLTKGEVQRRPCRVTGAQRKTPLR